MKKDIVLQFDNLTFRLPTYNDIDCLVELKNNKNSSYLLGGNTPTYTSESIRKWIDFHNSNPNELLLVVYDELAKCLIGHVGLYDIDRIANKAEYGILLGDDEYRGKGYGFKCTSSIVKYAFNALNLHKVTAEVLVENKASEAMFRKCGFKIDGVLRDECYKNDRFYDVLVMSILATEL